MNKRQIATGNERLLKLADFLEQLPPKRFKYDEWVGEDWKGAKDLSCGTTGCALGWATTMPRFRRMGLVLSTKSIFGAEAVPFDTKTGEAGAEASLRIFALNRREADYLFIPRDLTAPEWRVWHDNLIGYYGEAILPASPPPTAGASAKTVAKHIRQFVASRS